MQILIPFFLCALFLAAMYILMRLSLYFSNLFARRAILKSGHYTEKTVHALLYAYFGNHRLRSHVYLPKRTKLGTVYEKYDHILILGSKVVIIQICEEDGKIENLSSGEYWYRTERIRTEYDKRIPFENPITSGKERAKALSDLFENAHCDFHVPVESIAIFPSRRIKFSVPRQKEIMSPPEAVRKLLEMNKEIGFSKEEKKSLLKTIRRFSRTASYAAAKNRKLRHR